MVKKIIAAALVAETSLLAHAGAGNVSGIVAGFSHPFGGADHLLAMLAVGLWASVIGGRAVWALPLSFVVMMLSGAVMGADAIALPYIEAGILASVLVFGALIGMGIRLPTLAGSAIVGFFALFHGYAHGAEMPLNAGGIEYGVGMLLATALLHLAGITAGKTFQAMARSGASRVAGGVIVAAGMALGAS